MPPLSVPATGVADGGSFEGVGSALGGPEPAAVGDGDGGVLDAGADGTLEGAALDGWRDGSGLPLGVVVGRGVIVAGGFGVGRGVAVGRAVGFGVGFGVEDGAGGAIPGGGAAPPGVPSSENDQPSTLPGGGLLEYPPSGLYFQVPPRSACQYDQYALAGGVCWQGSSAGFPSIRQRNCGIAATWAIWNPACFRASKPLIPAEPAAQATTTPPPRAW